MRTLEMLRCLSDLTRARIVHLLALRGPELCVCDIVTTLGLPQSTVSRQLMVLRYLGLVNDRRNGVWMHYSVAEPASRGHKLMLDVVHSGFADEPVFSDDLKRFDELKAQAKVQRRGACNGRKPCATPQRTRVRTRTRAR